MDKIIFEELSGNAKIKKILGGDILNGRQGHAYIIEGDEGSGKHTAALLTAAAVACNEKDNEFGIGGKFPGGRFPCGKCPACRKVFSGNSPDVIYINRGTKATIGVEQVRNLKNDIYISANETDRKIYIIEDAHTMTPQAQNAFLLSLEEPPPHVLYLLLTSDSSLLLETVRSRAPILRMEPLKPDVIEAYLIKNNKNAQKMMKTEPEKLKEVVMSAKGSIGYAVSLLDAKKSSAALEKRRLVCELVNALRSPSLSEAYSTMASMPQKRDELSEIISLAQTAVRDILIYKDYPGAELCFFSDDDEQMKKLSSKISRQRLSVLYSILGETSASLKLNASVTTSLYSLVSKNKLKG